MKYPILLALLMAATAAQAASSQEYVFKDQPFESGSLSTDGKDFSISTVSSRGNLCDLGGRLKNNIYRDDEGCEIHFAFSGNKVRVTTPETAQEACSKYCGFNAHFADDYYQLPAACTETAAKNSEQRFQTAFTFEMSPNLVAFQLKPDSATGSNRRCGFRCLCRSRYRRLILPNPATWSSPKCHDRYSGRDYQSGCARLTACCRASSV